MQGNRFVCVPCFCVMSMAIHSDVEGIGSKAYVFRWASSAPQLVDDVVGFAGVMTLDGVGFFSRSRCKRLGRNVEWTRFTASAVAGV